ncbi:histone H1-II-like [Macadamia integrifolia]|uniref:histone H1-II-like n=1 Tax=Macadamia integrifolia TaxID=60698 RepID=UPI001C4F1338|nr:histone H1-II-like [Macadamia integrifolia]
MAKATIRTGATAKPNSEIKKTTTLLHPPYFQMITEAISSLKDRTGSSQPAIAKFIDEKYGTGLPPNFKKVLSIQLKKFAQSERLVKVKNSYKISATEKVKSVSRGVEVKRQRKDNAAVETVTVKMDKKKKKKIEEKVKKTKEAGMVSTPKNKKKPVKTLKPKASIKKIGKVKRLSQVKTPEALKKKRAPTPWKASKSIKGSKAVPKKVQKN